MTTYTLGFTGAEIDSRLGSAGTALQPSSLSDLAQTWNDAGTTFTAIKMNVTDTASNAASLLMDLQVGGASKFSVSKSAGAVFGNNLIEQRNSTNPQTFNLYNTYTDGSNYERVAFSLSSTGISIKNEVLGTGAAAGGLFIGAGDVGGSLASESTFIGKNAGKSYIGTSGFNVFIGNECATNGINFTGGGNILVGSRCAPGIDQNSGNNVFIGEAVKFERPVETLANNVIIGSQAAVYSSATNGCIFIGNRAGYFEGNNDTLFIDNTSRTNAVTSRLESIVYGKMSATKALQLLRFNTAYGGSELAADPADPDEGTHVIWQSDGTGTGDDGDILIKITAGGVTKTATLVDFSTV